MTYNIGQIIYVLSNKTQTVLPGIVQEEIHYRSLNGENVSYKIAIGPQNKQRIVDFSVAACALKHSIAGDYNLVTLKEVENMIDGDGSALVSR